jgi:hypothetical protein
MNEPRLRIIHRQLMTIMQNDGDRCERIFGVAASRMVVSKQLPEAAKSNSAASSLQLSLNSGILRSSADDRNRHTHSTDDGSRSGRRKRKRRKLRAYTFSGGRPRH